MPGNGYQLVPVIPMIIATVAYNNATMIIHNVPMACVEGISKRVQVVEFMSQQSKLCKYMIPCHSDQCYCYPGIPCNID